MPRKSAKMIRNGHMVTTANGKRAKVTAVRTVTSDTLGDLIEIELDNGETWRRTPGSKIHVG